MASRVNIAERGRYPHAQQKDVGEANATIRQDTFQKESSERPRVVLRRDKWK